MGHSGLSRSDAVLAGAVGILIILVAVAIFVPKRASSRVSPPRSVRAALEFLPSNPCGRSLLAPASYEHVVWIWFENERLASVIGNEEAPFITGLAQRYCGHGTAWMDNVLDTDSLPNYIAAAAGANCDSGTLRRGEPDRDRCITENDAPAAACTDVNCPGTIAARSIFEQIQDAGRTWKVYAESMPGNCSNGNPSGHYWVKHNPAVYFSHLRIPGRFDGDQCSLFDVPFPTTACDGTTCHIAGGRNNLADDLAHGSLPAFSMIIPNICNDMHDECGAYDSGVRNGDDWLSAWLPKIVNSKTYLDGTTAVFVLWDEGDFGSPMPNVVVAPTVIPRTAVGTTINNIAVLRATEEIFGLDPLGCASGTQGDGSPCPDGSTANIRSLFNI